MPKAKKPKLSRLAFTRRGLMTLFEALNGYIHLENNCSEHGPDAKFYQIHRKLEDYLVGGS